MMFSQKQSLTIQNQRFKKRLEASCPNYAYQILLLQIIVEDDHYGRKPTIDEISRLIQLYVIAVEVLESASDNRFGYFNRKIQALMMKKHIVEQMLVSTAGKVDQKAMLACNKAELQVKKTEHQIQVYFNKADNAKVQDILKKSEEQFEQINGKIQSHIKVQQSKLEERIKNRKLRSEAGSVSKFKTTADTFDKQGPKPQSKAVDHRFEYFNDYYDAPARNKNMMAPQTSNPQPRKVHASVDRNIQKKLKSLI